MVTYSYLCLFWTMFSVPFSLIEAFSNSLIDCPSGWVKGDTSCYISETSQGVTWEQARFMCQSQQADLASINEANEQVLINLALEANDIPKDEDYWIGLRHNKNQHLAFYWVDGTTTVNFSNWMRGQPNKFTGVEVVAANGKGWKDLPESALRLHFVCERQLMNIAKSMPVPVNLETSTISNIIGEQLINPRLNKYFCFDADIQKGLKGEKGDRGLQGPPGVTGPNGLLGPAGGLQPIYVEFAQQIFKNHLKNWWKRNPTFLNDVSKNVEDHDQSKEKCSQNATPLSHVLNICRNKAIGTYGHPTASSHFIVCYGNSQGLELACPADHTWEGDQCKKGRKYKRHTVIMEDQDVDENIPDITMTTCFRFEAAILSLLCLEFFCIVFVMVKMHIWFPLNHNQGFRGQSSS